MANSVDDDVDDHNSDYHEPDGNDRKDSRLCVDSVNYCHINSI